MKTVLRLPSSRLFLFGLYFLASFLLFGRSINYDFVYDDLWRIKNNAALLDLAHPSRFFLDPETQSSFPKLNKDTYRPLLTLNFAVERKLWGENPGGYRLLNIFLHAVNATMVFTLGEVVLGLSLTGGFLAGLFFLIHPVQLESVVWVVERSNIMTTLLMLFGLMSWIKFRKGNKRISLFFTYLSFLSGLLYRENAVCLPFLIITTDLYTFRHKGSQGTLPWKNYIGLFTVALFFVLWRQHMLGTLKQIEFWGGNVLTNLMTVAKTWPHYLISAMLPRNLSVDYVFLPVSGFLDWKFLWGAALLTGYLAVTIWSFRHHWKISFCLVFFLIFWLPTSGLIPLVTLYADRFMYPMIGAGGLLLGLLFDSISKHFHKFKIIRRSALALISLYLAALAFQSIRYLPCWRNEVTLWENAARVDPDDAFAWFCLGLAQEELAIASSNGERSRWADLAARSYRNALNQKVKSDFGGEIFLKLAGMNLLQGNDVLAREHASRALLLRPDLKDKWKAMQMELKGSSGR